MKYDAKEFKQYPEIMNKEQMRIQRNTQELTRLRKCITASGIFISALPA